MSVNMASSDPHLRFASVTLPPPPINATKFDHDWAVVAKNSISYAGTYRITSINPSPESKSIGRGVKLNFEGEVRHGPLAVASYPGMVGSTQVREFGLHHTKDREGGVLLKLRGVMNGLETVIWWVKLT